MVRKCLLASAAAVCMVVMNEAAAVADSGQQDQGGPITSFYGVNGGPIDPFYGTVNPFYGAIYQDYGQINPFWGDITPFWGDINPFYGTIQPFYGNIDPFWAKQNPFSGPLAQVYPFWHSAGPQWGNINALWSQLQASNATDYSQLQAQLNSFVSSMQKQWGPQAQQFAQQMFAKYGIDPTNPTSLAATSAETRSAFFLNFYDSAMDLAKLDHVDWWMAAVHWSPQLVQTQTAGTTRPGGPAGPGATCTAGPPGPGGPGPGQGRNRVGLLDASISGNNSDVKNLQFIGGYGGYVNNHGAAVASLLAAQEDNAGAMGVSPCSYVRLYNPFDTTGTASWSDVTRGIRQLYHHNSTVINASLGVPGWTLSSEWGRILSAPTIQQDKHYFVFVKAAGNQGVAQSKNIAWPAGQSAPTNLLMVGSVGPTDAISQFSNTPGEACILVNGACQEQNKLKYRFLVAPGELMLVEDNQGGVTRMTGTSFAAPLVSGAVALLQTRWPWLRRYSDETVQILFQSATDLGAPGVDPVYGWGMLNIEAAQSPLNLDNISVFQPFTYKNQPISVDQGSPNWTPAALKAALQNSNQLSQWEQQQAYLVAYENTGSTYRDFLIPLSSKLIGKTQNVNGVSHPFQSYIYERLLNWAQGVPSPSTAAHLHRSTVRKKHR